MSAFDARVIGPGRAGGALARGQFFVAEQRQRRIGQLAAIAQAHGDQYVQKCVLDPGPYAPVLDAGAQQIQVCQKGKARQRRVAKAPAQHSRSHGPTVLLDGHPVRIGVPLALNGVEPHGRALFGCQGIQYDINDISRIWGRRPCAGLGALT